MIYPEPCFRNYQGVCTHLWLGVSHNLHLPIQLVLIVATYLVLSNPTFETLQLGPRTTLALDAVSASFSSNCACLAPFKIGGEWPPTSSVRLGQHSKGHITLDQWEPGTVPWILLDKTFHKKPPTRLVQLTAGPRGLAAFSASFSSSA